MPGAGPSNDKLLQARLFSYHDTQIHRRGPNYWPNSFGGPAPDPSAADPVMTVSGETGRMPYPHEIDDVEQAERCTAS